MSSRTETPPSRILFGSCNSQQRDQTLWPAIAARKAAAFVWAGDAVYADDFERSWGFLKHKDATSQEHFNLLQEQLQHPGYKLLVDDPSVTILGALDDHDYGSNNGDITYKHRALTGANYVQFLEHHKPATNLTLMLQRARAGKGVYGVKVFDFSRESGQELLSDAETAIDVPLGSTDDVIQLSTQSVAVFILDVRSNKAPWKRGLKKYAVDYEDDFLGEEQWAWFEQTLSRSTAEVNIVVQGLQVHSDRFADGNLVEDWSRFPSAQHKLYQTLLSSNVKAPILTSGDVHMAELLRKDCKRSQDTHARMLLEVTSSGLTHSWGTRVCARPKSIACRIPYIDWSLKMGMYFAHENRAWTELVLTDNVEEGAKAGAQFSLELNFGEFEFDWTSREVIIRVHGGDTDVITPYLSTRWDFDLLSGISRAESVVSDIDFDNERENIHQNGNGSLQDFACVAYRGPQTIAKKVYGFVTPSLVSIFFLSVPLVAGCLLFMFFAKRRRPKKFHSKVD